MELRPEASADPEAPSARRPCCAPWTLCVTFGATALLLLVLVLLLLLWGATRGSVALPMAPPDGLLPRGAQAGPPHAPQQGQATFAKLLAKNVSLVNGTLSWHSKRGLAGVFLSPDLSYDEDSHQLVMAEAGVYFVFLRMQLARVMMAGPPPQGQVSLTLQLQPPPAEATDLVLTVTLPQISSSKGLDSNSTRGFWGHLVPLQSGQRLSVRLSAHLRGGAGAPHAWQLAPHAVFGLFRITGEVPEELFT